MLDYVTDTEAAEQYDWGGGGGGGKRPPSFPGSAALGQMCCKISS